MKIWRWFVKREQPVFEQIQERASEGDPLKFNSDTKPCRLILYENRADFETIWCSRKCIAPNFRETDWSTRDILTFMLPYSRQRKQLHKSSNSKGVHQLVVLCIRCLFSKNPCTLKIWRLRTDCLGNRPRMERRMGRTPHQISAVGGKDHSCLRADCLSSLLLSCREGRFISDEIQKKRNRRLLGPAGAFASTPLYRI
jgi:hypothetical protein